MNLNRPPGLMASNYILNIVELQNTITSAGGTSPFNTLSNQVAQIQEMVNYGQKQINANVISAFDQPAIQVISPLNLSNVTLTANGVPVTGGASTTTIGTASTTFQVSDAGLFFIQNGGVSTFQILSTGNAIFQSSVTAASFITASDERLKRNVRPIVEYETILSSIRGVRFDWKIGGASDVGVIAQEVEGDLPEAVVTGIDGYKGVSYMKFVPVLIEAVKSLQARVSTLEALTIAK